MAKQLQQHSAIVCRSNDGYEALKLETVPTVAPQGNEILVEIKAAGLNYPDVLICEGKYQMQPPHPFTPGGEFSGTVVAKGPDAHKFQLGDPVIALTGWGAFQEKITLAETQCVKIPAFLPLDVAGGFLFTYGTTIHALRGRAQLKPGETVLILGASGGTGVSAIEIAKAMGATVIACASSEEKLQVCREFGADFVVNYGKENLRRRVMELAPNGVDVVYDAVGGDQAEPALRCMAWKGRYLVIGFVGGIPKIPLNLTLLKGCSIVGVFWGAFTSREPKQFEIDVQQLFQWYAEKKIKPVNRQTFALKDAARGIESLKARRVFGKAIVTMSKL